MKESNVLEYLIKNACPSISFRVKKEILKEEIAKKEKDQYFSEITKSLVVKKVLQWQEESGYFGNRLHTPLSNSKVWSHEGSLRYLLEMGFDLSFEPIKKATDALLLDDWRRECVGKAAEIFGAGNVRASLLAQAGLEKYDLMQEWIEIALQAFKYIYDANNITDIAIPYKGEKQVFIEDKYFPTIYHLRILAFSYSWRTNENLDMISKALSKLYLWLPIKPTYIKVASQLVAPGGNIAFEYNKDLTELDGKYAFWWISFYELIARMGMLDYKSPFLKHFNSTWEKVINKEGFFVEKFDKRGFFNWSGYSGMALEDNWGKNHKHINDLTFRMYLIKSYIRN